jgi:uncharacterized membrane protein (DUF373 family)
MNRFRKLTRWLRENSTDQKFLRNIHYLENWISKILSVALIVVILISVIELVINLATELFSPPFGRIETNLLEIFGLFLNILIALELLENITAYLKKHIVQVELVIVTSLIAVARKIIIYDTSKDPTHYYLIGLAFAILALSVSYWLIKRSHSNTP